MGGSSTTTQVYQPTPPAQPSTAEAVNAWVGSLPQVYQAQLEYAPKEAAQQVQLAQQYAGQMGQAYLDAQKAMYPQEYALKDTLSQQAQEGMTGQMPDWMREQYRDTFAANLGTNAGSGIGADYMSTNLLNAQQNYNDYYRNLALSLSGSQPVYQSAQTPGYSNYMSTYTPQNVMGYTAQNYGTYAQASRPITLQNQQGAGGVSLGFLGQWGGR